MAGRVDEKCAMLHCDDAEEYYASGIALYIEGVRAMLQLAAV